MGIRRKEGERKEEKTGEELLKTELRFRVAGFEAESRVRNQALKAVDGFVVKSEFVCVAFF